MLLSSRHLAGKGLKIRAMTRKVDSDAAKSLAAAGAEIVKGDLDHAAYRQTGIPHFENTWRIEQTVRGLGFPSWVIIRPVFFMESLTSPWFLIRRACCRTACRPWPH